MIDGVEESFVHAIIVKRRYCVFVAAISNLVLDEEESGPKVVDRFRRLLLYACESTYVWVGGWNWI